MRKGCVFFLCLVMAGCGLSPEEQQAANEALLVGARISYKQRARKAVVEALEKGAQINAQDDLGRTALHWAAYYKHDQIIRILIEDGADIHMADRAGQTVLHLAADNQYLEEIKPLLEGEFAPAKTGRSVPDYDSPLFTPEEHLSAVQFLVTEGAGVNVEDNFGQTVLDLVLSRENHEEAVAAFLKAHGAEQSDDGFSFEFPDD